LAFRSQGRRTGPGSPPLFVFFSCSNQRSLNPLLPFPSFCCCGRQPPAWGMFHSLLFFSPPFFFFPGRAAAQDRCRCLFFSFPPLTPAAEMGLFFFFLFFPLLPASGKTPSGKVVCRDGASFFFFSEERSFLLFLVFPFP